MTTDSAADAADNRLRTLLTRFIAETARAPGIDELARLSGQEPEAVREALRRLERRRGLLLHPHEARPWIVHPFSLSPSSCWVQAEDKGWWAPCLYCAFGIAGCTGADVVVTTRLGGEAETVRYCVTGGALEPTADLFHFATPPLLWWDNVVHTCATFQPFRTAADIESWCARHGIERGAAIAVERLFPFALDWYRPHATEWAPRTADEIRDCFRRHGLDGPFWAC